MINIHTKTSGSESLFNKVATLFKRVFSTDVLLWIIAKLPTAIFIKYLRWDLSILWNGFYYNTFVDMVRVRYLQIIGRNHSNTLFLISLQKTKTCSKWSTAAKGICSDIRILTVHAGFCLLLHVYFSAIQINTLLYLSSSL